MFFDVDKAYNGDFARAVHDANLWGDSYHRGIVLAGNRRYSIREMEKWRCNVIAPFAILKESVEKNGPFIDVEMEKARHRTIIVGGVEGFHYPFGYKPIPKRSGIGIRFKTAWESSVKINKVAGFKVNVLFEGTDTTGNHVNDYYFNTVGHCDYGFVFKVTPGPASKRIEVNSIRCEYMVLSRKCYIWMFDQGGDSTIQDNEINIEAVEMHVDKEPNYFLVMSGNNIYRNKINVRKKITMAKNLKQRLVHSKGAYQNEISLPQYDFGKIYTDKPQVWGGNGLQYGTPSPGSIKSGALNVIAVPEPPRTVVFEPPTILVNDYTKTKKPAFWVQQPDGSFKEY